MRVLINKARYSDKAFKLEWLILNALCLFILLSSFYVTAADKEALPLNGLDTYNYMGKDYYWLAHYTQDSCQSAQACSSSASPSFYRLKVIAKRWTPQNFNLIWQRELATNNKNVLERADTNAIIAFTQLPKSQLTHGDMLDIYFDGSNTQISVNNAVAYQSSGKTLYNYLSRIWIGDIPPSRNFRNNILKGHNGPHDPEKLDAVKAISVAPNRIAILKEWQAITSSEKLVKNSLQEEKTLKTGTKEKPNIISKENTKVARSGQAIARPASVTPPSIKSNVPATTKKETPTKVVSAKEVPPAAPKKSIKRNSNQSKKSTPANKDKNNEPSAAEALAIYQWQLYRKIHQSVEYPTWAKELKQEGVVTVNFTLDETLNKVNIISFEPTYAGLLADAVIAAIHKTTPPQPAWPVAVNTNIVMSYQHEFSLLKKQPPPTLPKKLLAFYQADEQKGNSNRILSSEDLAHYLRKKISYPYWARDMGLEGIITAAITLNENGEIKDIQLIEKSRHNDLNKALLTSILSASPLPMAPQAKNQELTLNYTHHFKR